jgi:hypothetical protein
MRYHVTQPQDAAPLCARAVRAPCAYSRTYLYNRVPYGSGPPTRHRTFSRPRLALYRVLPPTNPVRKGRAMAHLVSLK